MQSKINTPKALPKNQSSTTGKVLSHARTIPEQGFNKCRNGCFMQHNTIYNTLKSYRRVRLDFWWKANTYSWYLFHVLTNVLTYRNNKF